jgi:mannose-1-phosphate guanylyltransferase
MSQRFIVIIAGGRGERFWPQSRTACPKHLLPIVGKKPMLLQTLDRVSGLVPRKNILVITSAAQEKAVRKVCAALPKANIVAEPVGRDTAPAVALAAALVSARDPKGVFAVLPADHVIHDCKAYQSDLKTAFAAAEKADVMVTIGIRPTEPATGFGYVQRGPEWESFGQRCVYTASRFVEKPNLATARKYLTSGDYLWNAGMFIWRASTIEAALHSFAAELHSGLAPVRTALAKGRALGPVLKKVYPTLNRISIDYAILEKSDNVVVLPSSFDWDDVGAWPSVSKHLSADEGGNVHRGLAVTEQASHNIVYSEGGHLVAVLGVDNLIVVHTKDATLVCSKEKSQDIKALLKKVAELRKGERFL